MINNIPAELLLNILSYLDNLEPISSTSQSLSLATRDFRTHELRARLANITHVELLMRIWSPPTFFRRGGSSYGSGGYFTRPQDLHNILCDPDMFSRIEAYLGSLERRAYVAARVAEYVMTIVSFNSFRTSAEMRFYAMRIVIELWSPQARFSHDIDGRWLNLGDDSGLIDVHVEDDYVLNLPRDVQAAMLSVYDALAQNLRPPFYSSSRRRHGGRASEGEGIWLYRLIVKEGMDAVLHMIEQRSGR
ncbi:hypothetical protein L873DRAFT_1135465 [Choiromyces venosus 120613-1]|uniref:F-box domain-containing protein n=1 Tax=Choiromyces venosus 120613-1 TaxID=1336337 RepID=A0A3N4JGQ5_9PEZI|nr:hypothetical protein L873DRAFT_1135465 [Choiromyces venosus 120613-1]